MEVDDQTVEPKPSAAVINLEPSYIEAQIEIKDTQEYSPKIVDSVASLTSVSTMNQEHSEGDLVTNTLSTRESSSDLSLREQYENIHVTGDHTVATIASSPEAFVIIRALDEYDSPNKEIVADVPEEIEEYEMVSDDRGEPRTSEVLHQYPHIIIKLCDGEIINAVRGEKIINISQFMVDHEVNENVTSVINSSFSLSPRLIINNVYIMSTQEPGQWNQDLTSDGDYLELNPEIPPSQQFSQFEIDKSTTESNSNATQPVPRRS